MVRHSPLLKRYGLFIFHKARADYFRLVFLNVSKDLSHLPLSDHSRHQSTIAFRFIPNSVVTEPIAAVWVPRVQEPWYKLPRIVRLTIGWLCLLGIVFGSAFGFPLTGVSYATLA